MEPYRSAPLDFDESRYLYYNREGRPITLEEFFIFRQDDDYTILKTEQIGHFLFTLTWAGYTVSMNDKPLIFDIIVFDLRGGAKFNFHVEKAATEKEALAIYDYLVKNHPRLDANIQEIGYKI